MIAIAIAMNNIYVPKEIGLIFASSLKLWYRPYEMAQPRPNGNAIPAKPTLAAILQLLVRYLRSTSSPTRNKKSTNPRLATRVKLGIESVGKIVSVK